MYQPVSTKNPAAVEAEVQALCRSMFPNNDLSFIGESFDWIGRCFKGDYGDYQPLDARYHDFEHTLQGTLCLMRLLKGRHVAGASPRLDLHGLRLVLLAVLMHDTGYLKTRDDTQGSGAKYTITHVSRSAEFAARFLRDKGFPASDVRAVQNMIRCTGVDSTSEEIPFQSALERVLGFALASSDLLGQMAAADYPAKLPALYSEFAEASRFSNTPSHFIASFTSADDLMRRTPSFWKDVVLKKLERDFEGLYRFLNEPYPNGRNEYVAAVEQNVRGLVTACQVNTP
jgi:hypothetical protein